MLISEKNLFNHILLKWEFSTIFDKDFDEANSNQELIIHLCEDDIDFVSKNFQMIMSLH